MARTRVAVLMGGPSAEHEVSLASGRMVAAALDPARYAVTPVVIGRDGVWRTVSLGDLQPAPLHPATTLSVPGDPRATLRGAELLLEADVVFLALHGRFGEDGTIQGLLELLGIPYTGSGPLASALAMRKDKAKQLFRVHGLRVARSLLVPAQEILGDADQVARRVVQVLGLPVVVKPEQGGSSVGVARAETADALQAALGAAAAEDAAVLVEELVTGVEVTGAVLEAPDGSPEALPLVEIVPRRAPIFDFASKYAADGAEEIVPARLGDAVRAACQAAAVTAHLALGCRGVSRTDIIVTHDGPVVLELNTIPGLTPQSLLPKAAKAAGLSFAALVERLVEAALARHRASGR